MKLSIITPTLNSMKYLQECANSILLNQNYDNFEWLIIDGGSTDSTIEILKSYQSSKIKIIKDNSNHPSIAYNNGVKAATGDILGTLGSDDIYEKNIFDEIIKIFSNNQIDWLIGHNSIIDSKSNEVRKIITNFKTKKINNFSYESLTLDNYVPMQSVFWRKIFMPDKIGYFNNEEFIESMDYDTWLRMAKVSKPHILKKKLSSFRVHKGSITSKVNLKQMNEMTKISIKHGRINFFVKCYLYLKTTIIILVYRVFKIFY